MKNQCKTKGYKQEPRGTNLIDVVDVLGVAVLVEAQHAVRVAVLRLDPHAGLATKLSNVSNVSNISNVSNVTDVVAVPRIHGGGLQS